MALQPNCAFWKLHIAAGDSPGGRFCCMQYLSHVCRDRRIRWSSVAWRWLWWEMTGEQLCLSGCVC